MDAYIFNVDAFKDYVFEEMCIIPGEYAANALYNSIRYICKGYNNLACEYYYSEKNMNYLADDLADVLDIKREYIMEYFSVVD